MVESTDKFAHDDTVKFIAEVGILHAAVNGRVVVDLDNNSPLTVRFYVDTEQTVSDQARCAGRYFTDFAWCVLAADGFSFAGTVLAGRVSIDARAPCGIYRHKWDGY